MLGRLKSIKNELLNLKYNMLLEFTSKQQIIIDFNKGSTLDFIKISAFIRA